MTSIQNAYELLVSHGSRAIWSSMHASSSAVWHLVLSGKVTGKAWIASRALNTGVPSLSV